MTTRASSKPTRRAFAAGCGALPVLAGLFHGARRAQAQTAPRTVGMSPLRLIIFAHTEGNIPAIWRPTGTETSFTLSNVTKALEPWKARSIVVDGVNSTTAIQRQYGDTHRPPNIGMLTGNAPLSRTGPAFSASLDQAIAEKVRGQARLASFEAGVAGAGTMTISYPDNGGTGIVPIATPPAAFDRLFAGGAAGVVGDDAEARRLRTRRASVLDQVARELGTIPRTVGRDDAAKIQAHLDAVRDLEKQVSRPPINCGTLTKPTDPTGIANVPAAAKLQMDLIVQALACDMVRVVTFGISSDGFQRGAPWLGETRDFHLISHGRFGDWTVAGPLIMRWMYEQQAYLLKALESVREGGETLLDHTLVLSIGQFGDSGAHQYKDLPIIITGSAGGYFRTGRYVKLAGVAHNNILITVAQAMGVPMSTFGDAKLCTGPIAELRA